MSQVPEESFTYASFRNTFKKRFEFERLIVLSSQPEGVHFAWDDARGERHFGVTFPSPVRQLLDVTKTNGTTTTSVKTLGDSEAWEVYGVKIVSVSTDPLNIPIWGIWLLFSGASLHQALTGEINGTDTLPVYLYRRHGFDEVPSFNFSGDFDNGFIPSTRPLWWSNLAPGTIIKVKGAAGLAADSLRLQIIGRSFP
mgnify:CR=1 FL=1